MAALADFLNNFATKSSKAYQIDPLNFFTVKFELFPIDSNIKKLFNNITGNTNVFEKYDLTMFVQNIDLPSINVINDTAAETIVGSIQTHKMFITPSDQTFKMSIINTKMPLLENCIYPWIREITTPAWLYTTCPYTTAKFYIDFGGADNDYHSNIKYVLNGVRPTSITPIKPSQETNQKLDREVTFTFDYMYVQQSDEQASTNSSFMVDPIVL